MKKELIAPCGMNCALCVSYFGYTMSGKERKKAFVLDADQEIKAARF